MTDRILLNGQVVEWKDRNDEGVAIAADEAERYEREGWIVLELGGDIYATRFRPFEDGTIQLQSKFDKAGLAASHGRHTNRGYSGYFKGYVYVGGKRKALVDWRPLFPGEEHRFARQMDKPDTIGAIRAIVEPLAGGEVVKVKGGYAFNVAQLPIKAK